jgi:pimeloyl-ACP methyl ester carboxylesterase
VVTHRTIRTNGIDMHIAEAGPTDGRPVVLCHGFPELWYSWRHQLPALADAGFRAIAPDQRGYGQTTQPDDVASYDIVHLTDDLVGLLDALGLDCAVFAGHDWGSPVVNHMALAHPERVQGVVTLSVPFLRRAPLRPSELWEMAFKDVFFYIRYFQDVGPADEELGVDARRSLRMFLWAISGDAPPGSYKVLPREGTRFLDAMEDPEHLPGWLSERDLECFASEFERTGFTGGLNWYRNFDRNWELTEHLADAKVTAPALFIGGDRDPVVAMTGTAIDPEFVTDLRGTVVLPGIGHWTQQEAPDEVNRALLEFLSQL